MRIELIVGMAVQDGISEKDHNGFQELVDEYNGLFSCRYVAYGPPVHTKTYAWCFGDMPTYAFTGSANYTQSAFATSRREAMIEHDATHARGYFDLINQDTVDCHDPQVSDRITIYSQPSRSLVLLDGETEEIERAQQEAGDAVESPRSTKTVVSLLNRWGEVSERSGLNWGHRPEYNRNLNQAYIPLKAPVARTDFFPPRGVHFTIITDDNKQLLCVRAQDGDKAIETPDSNSKMGLYFRYRLDVPEGSKIVRGDLERYGRTDVDFYKLDDETFYMDFSV